MVEAADAAVKAAKVELVAYEKTGGGYVDRHRPRRRRGGEGRVRRRADRAAGRVGEVVAVHVIARPHANVDPVMPLGRASAKQASSRAPSGRYGRARGSAGGVRKGRSMELARSWERSSRPARSRASTGLKLLLVRPLDEEGRETGNALVAADAVGAGPDEIVLIASGSSARQTEATDKRPVDAWSWRSSTAGTSATP